MASKIQMILSISCGILALIIFIATLIQGEISFVSGCLGWFCTFCWASIGFVDNIRIRSLEED